MRVEGLPMLNLWSQILLTLSGKDPEKSISLDAALKEYNNITLESVDYMPASLPPLVANTRLVMVEDNDAVIKMLKKGRAPSMVHVSRTHRCNLDWLLERSINDPCIFTRYIETKQQIADLLTKPNFSVKDWCNLCELLRLGPPPKAGQVEVSCSDGSHEHLKSGSHDRLKNKGTSSEDQFFTPPSSPRSPSMSHRKAGGPSATTSATATTTKTKVSAVSNLDLDPATLHSCSVGSPFSTLDAVVENFVTVVNALNDEISADDLRALRKRTSFIRHLFNKYKKS